MPLRPPHEYKVNTGARSIDIVRENPTVRFSKAPFLRVGTAADGSGIFDPNPRYHDPIVYQDGKFYFDNGNEVPKKEVPTYILEHLRKHPPAKPNVLGVREIRMTPEEAEKMFGDTSLDTRIAARQAQAKEEGAEEDGRRLIRRRKPQDIKRRARR